VEEIWTDLAKPGKKNPAVVSEMAKTLLGMRSCWIDDGAIGCQSWTEFADCFPSFLRKLQEGFL
jgi:hypothetical protein